MNPSDCVGIEGLNFEFNPEVNPPTTSNMQMADTIIFLSCRKKIKSISVINRVGRPLYRKLEKMSPADRKK
jgi:hypothetical protein